MALSSTDLDRLDAAIATSELEVEVDGQRVRYRSVAELIAARAHVSTVLSGSGASGAAPRQATYYPTMSLRRER